MTTNELILFIDNDRQELVAVLDLTCKAMSRANNHYEETINILSPELQRRYEMIFGNMVRIGHTSFQKSIESVFEDVLNNVDWVDMSLHYIGKVLEGVTVPSE